MAKRRGKTAKIKPVQVLVVTRQDEDGHLWSSAIAGKDDVVDVWIASGKDLAKLKVGERALTRISPDPTEGFFIGEVMKALPQVEQEKIFGKVGGGFLLPSDKRDRRTYRIVGGEDHEDGQLVVTAITRKRRAETLEVEVIEVLGEFGDVQAISPLTLAEEGIPVDFPEAAIEQAEQAEAPTLEPYRTDLRKLPLVTIDGEDARDFDDAVYAEPHKGGFRIWVAIADVSFYVPQGSALDQEAEKRGNSVYLPDMVVPMLPEVLSNGWCSLNPDEDRACMAVRMDIDDQGQLKTYKFVRGLMRSHARLTYNKVQAWMDGEAHEIPEALVPHLTHLKTAFESLRAARLKRGTLDLDMPERRAIISEDRTEVLGIAERSMGPANQLIEEMMVLANVACARAFAAVGRKGIYRVHDEPAMDKVQALAKILEGTPAEIPQKTAKLTPMDFSRILHLCKDQPYEETVKEQVLRSQAMAIYDLTNIGHFGLGLQDYSHFTSPIRRYSDLMAHRALIAAYGLGPGGKDLDELKNPGGTAHHISQTERKAQMAERRAHDRFVSAYHAGDVDEELTGRVTGVAKMGLFIRLDASGGDCFVPMSMLGPDRFDYDDRQKTITSRRSNQVFALGDQCLIRLLEASAHTGSLMGEMVQQLAASKLPQQSGNKPKTNYRPPKKGRGRSTKRRK